MTRQGLLQAVLDCPRGLARLNRNLHLLVQGYESPISFHYDFRKPWSRLGLLEPGTMRILADRFGLGLHWNEISRSIDAHTVSLLKQRFGEDGYQFAVKRAPFMVGNLANYLSRELALDLDSELSGIALCKRIGTHGRRGLAINFCGAPEGLVLRTVLKLPAGYLRVPLESPPRTVLAAVRTLLQKILLKEVAPQWQPCFD